MNLKLLEALFLPENIFTSDKWYSLVFVDTLKDVKKIIGIRKLEVGENVNDKALITYLYDYFNKIEQDNAASTNNICSKGCCSCCTSDFGVNITEYFAILQYIGIKFGTDAIESISEQAKLSFNSQRCIFVDNTDSSCKIYEVRPLICRKYGLYENSTDCPKLKGTELLQTPADTSKNILYFENCKNPHSKIICNPKRLVQWFSNMENGEFKTQRMRDLFNACFNQSLDEFVAILIKQ